MQMDYDSQIIVDHLWELHRPELVGEAQLRLAALVGTEVLCASASRHLEAYLLALAGDEATLKEIWSGKRPGMACAGDRFVLMDCFAHVHTQDQGIIDDIIAAVKRPGMFGPRREAMRTLGRLGAAAGSRAAAAIRNCIHDSSPGVTAERDRVLQRIETVATDWVRCGACCFGRVHRADSHGTGSCHRCLGLGYQHKQAIV
jgi:hypothetical protein